MSSSLNSVYIGSISGSIYNTTFSNNYYSQQDNINAVGGNNNDSYNNKKGEIESATPEQFSRGEIAHALREGGYGQSLNADGVYQNGESSPVLLAFDENKGKKVYQLNLLSEDENITIPETLIYRNAIESNLLPEDTYQDLIDEENDLDLVWYKGDESSKISINLVMSNDPEVLSVEDVKVGNSKVAYDGHNLVYAFNNDEARQLVVYTLDGRKVLEMPVVGKEGKITLSSLTDGIYVYSIAGQSGVEKGKIWVK